MGSKTILQSKIDEVFQIISEIKATNENMANINNKLGSIGDVDTVLKINSVAKNQAMRLLNEKLNKPASGILDKMLESMGLCRKKKLLES